MTTSKHSTGQNTGAQLTLLPEGSHVSHSAPQESERVQKMTAISGRTCLESFEKFSRPTLWAKTFMASLIGQGDWYSNRCVLTWKMKATRCNRLYFQLVVSTRRIEGTGYGLLHTPRVTMIEEPNENFVKRMGDRT